MFNPLALLSSASLSTKALLIGAVFLAGLFSGYKITTWRADAHKLTDVEKKVAVSTEVQKASAPIIQKRDARAKEIQIEYRYIHDQINNLPDANNICFNNDSLQLWNNAIQGRSDSNRGELAGRTSTTDSAGTSDKGSEAQYQDEVKINVGQLLHNATSNFETCQDNNNKHHALISKIRSLEGKMCVCSQ